MPIVREQKDYQKDQEFFMNESIINYETIKAFNNEELEQNRYNRLVIKLKQQAVLVQKTLTELNIGQSLIFNTGLIINLLMAAFQVSSGQITPGDFVLIQTLFLALDDPLHNVGTLFREVDQCTVDSEDLYRILNSQPRVQEKADAKEYEFKGGALEFKDVSFKYEKKADAEAEADEKEDKQILRNFNLKIEPGTANAIVGESGFGKTTIFNMMMRIYDPQKGSVTIDGQELKDLKFDSFRKHVTIIPQNGLLFNDSILFNLQYSNPDATMEDIIEVCKKCKIHDKII